jgi:hypothetical protein
MTRLRHQYQAPKKLEICGLIDPAILIKHSRQKVIIIDNCVKANFPLAYQLLL